MLHCAQGTERTAIDGCHHDTGHQGKKRMRALSLINSGSLESMKMSTEWSRTVDGVSFMEGGKKKPQWSQ